MELVENQEAKIRRKNGPRKAAGEIIEHVGTIHHVVFHLERCRGGTRLGLIAGQLICSW